MTEKKEQLRMFSVWCVFHRGGGVYRCIYTSLWRVQALILLVE